MGAFGGPVDVELDGVTGPGQFSSNQVFLNVIDLNFDLRRNSCIIIQDNPYNKTEWDQTQFDTITWNPSLREVTFTF